MKIKRKLITWIATAAPVILTGTTIGIVYKIKNDNFKNNDNDRLVINQDSDDEDTATSRYDPSIKYKKSDIFVELKTSDIYEFIRVDKNGTYFDKEISAKMIKIIVTGLGVTFGELKFEWQFKRRNHFIMNVYWYEKKGDIRKKINYLLMKTYSIKIENNNGI